MRVIFSAMAAVIVALSAPQDAMAMLDDTEELQGKTVVYAGEFEEISCPIGGKYNCLTWPSTLLKSRKGRDICLTPTSYVRCSYKCKGLIAVDESRGRHLFLFDSMGDLKRTSFELFQCPSLY